jgi:glycosyltransferase involved in cell wall biosynthesis
VTPGVEVVGIVVPARNEEDLLPAALSALARAGQPLPRRGVVVDLLVVADSCTDATATVARSLGVDVLEVSVGAVGPARAAGFQALLRRHPGTPRDRFWLASTDADSRVPANWLVGQLVLAATGADVVVGTVSVDDWSSHPPHVEARWRAGYDPRDGHGHVHGANVGARADAYVDVGGFAALESGEDVALVAALAHRRVLRTGAIPVLTSARPRSRAGGGFADHLAGLA